MKRSTYVFILLAVSLLISSCRSSTTVRGKVQLENRPVVGAEVRFGANMNESTTSTNHDGQFIITASHRSGEILELKVIKPGYAHDKIEFPASGSAPREYDIELKRIFDPASR
jgi:hypothetical protein